MGYITNIYNWLACSRRWDSGHNCAFSSGGKRIEGFCASRHWRAAPTHDASARWHWDYQISNCVSQRLWCVRFVPFFLRSFFECFVFDRVLLTSQRQSKRCVWTVCLCSGPRARHAVTSSLSTASASSPARTWQSSSVPRKTSTARRLRRLALASGAELLSPPSRHGAPAARSARMHGD